MVNNWNISKLAEPSFPRKFIFDQVLAKRNQIGPIIILFGFFEKYIKNLKSFTMKWSKMKTNILDISPPIPYLAKFLFLTYGPKCWQPIFRKAWGMKLIFCLQINMKVFYKLIVSLWVCIARHVHSTQNKFTISLQ